MIKVALCDDDSKELRQVYRVLEEYRADHPEYDMLLSSFSSPVDLIDHVETKGRQDIYILDIIMEEMNGIQVGQYIRQRDNEAVIILITSSVEYGVDSYSISANNYILKPFQRETVIVAVDKAVMTINREASKRYVISIAGGIHSLPYGAILYIEYYMHRLKVYTVCDGMVQSIVLRQSFTELIEPLISDGRFVRISSSYAVNMQHIRRITAKEVELPGGLVLPISRRYASARSKYADYMFSIIE